MKKTLITLAALSTVSVAMGADDLVLNDSGHYDTVANGTYNAMSYVAQEGNYKGIVYLRGNEVTFEVANATDTATFTYVQGNAGSNLIKTGDGKLIIGDAYNGAPETITVNDGTLSVGDSSGKRYAYNYVANSGGTLELNTAEKFYANSITLNSGSTLALLGTEKSRTLAETGALTLNGSVTFDLSTWNKSTDTYRTPDMPLFSGVTSLTCTSPVTFDFGNGNAGLYTLSLKNGSVYATYSGPVPAPVPEPATATLSLLALAGLAARRRRK